MNLSPNFTLAELTASQVAVRRGIDNSASPEIVGNLTRLASVLERVRALAGRPITVSSGYRCPPLNSWVGGASNSAHRTGLAADVTCSGITPKALATMIRDSDIAFDQLIYEGTWVHIGLSADEPRRQVLTANFSGGAATYSKGIL
jgi:hypothetical protein